MKNIIKTLILLFAFTACKAQTVYNIEGEEHFGKSGYYYKDVNNLFNKYEGTWIYTNGTTSLTIKLRKIVKQYIAYNNFYDDALVGEYEYVENGVIKASTLNQFNNTNLTSGYSNLASLNILQPYIRPVCNDCDEQVKRISIRFRDPQRKYLGHRCYIGLTNDTIPKLVFHLQEDEGLLIPEGAPIDRRIPSNHYIMTKQ